MAGKLEFRHHPGRSAVKHADMIIYSGTQGTGRNPQTNIDEWQRNLGGFGMLGPTSEYLRQILRAYDHLGFEVYALRQNRHFNYVEGTSKETDEEMCERLTLREKYVEKHYEFCVVLPQEEPESESEESEGEDVEAEEMQQGDAQDVGIEKGSNVEQSARWDIASPGMGTREASSDGEELQTGYNKRSRNSVKEGRAGSNHDIVGAEVAKTANVHLMSIVRGSLEAANNDANLTNSTNVWKQESKDREVNSGIDSETDSETESEESEESDHEL